MTAYKSYRNNTKTKYNIMKRRDFVKASSLAGLGLMIPSNPLDVLHNLNIDGKNYQFPKGFLWGVASAAAQVESRQGRARTDWDVFADWSGQIEDGSINDKCTEFETRYEDEIKLLSNAGIQAFRFSMSWARIQPDGSGKPSEKGLETYDRIIDTMLKHNIQPIVTMEHTDCPIWVGDFRYRDMSQRMADYADIVTKRYGDRVKQWIVMNEPNTTALEGYGVGKYAPGVKSMKALGAAIHHQNLAMALMISASRANLPATAKVGTTINVQPVRGNKDTPDYRKAIDFMDAVWNRAFMNPIYGKKDYCDVVKPMAAPFVQAGDMETLYASNPDFLGLNYYTAYYVKPDPASPVGIAQDMPPAKYPRTAYFPVVTDGLVETLERIHNDYGAPEILISETGFAFNDPAPVNGVVNDPERIKYISEYLKAVHAAIKKGIKVSGLMYWSSTDNWEWSHGFTKRFGLIHVDPKTQIRTPKSSLAYLGKCAKANTALEPNK